MWKENRRVLCGLGVAVLWCVGAFAIADPSAGTIAAQWQTMSGGREARVVFWDYDLYALCVMNLKTGQKAAIRNGEHSANKVPCWSPNGKRIFVRDNGVATVMDADGLNAKAVLAGAKYNQGSWWNDDWIVVMTGTDYKIQRVEVDADNNYVQTFDVVTDAMVGSERGYATMSGDYVAWWDSNAGSPYGDPHRCVIRNWQTMEEHYALPGDESCCGINLKRDGSGQYIYNYHHHLEPAPVQTFVGTYATRVAELSAAQGGEMWQLRWSNHGSYLAHMDKALGSPPVHTHPDRRAWVRKMEDSGNVLLGYGIIDPDVWVELATITVEIPNGGETWIGKSTEDVTWTTTGTVGNVKIELSTNGGASWTTLVASTSTGSPEPVTVPDVESTRCRIRVSELDGSPTDTSNADFTIVWADTDDDGIPDWWEEEHFSGATAADPAGDEEPDGLENLDEYLAGSDPHDEDTDDDGILDGVDRGPLNPSSPLTGGCSSGGAALPLAVALFWLATRLRGREAAVQ